MSSISDVGRGEKGRIRFPEWIAGISFLVWIISPLILDIIGYEKGPEYYLVGLIPLGLMLLVIWFDFKVGDSASKNMKIGIIVIFSSLIGMTLYLYFGKSLTIPAFTAMLEPLILIFVSLLIVMLVGVFLLLFSFSQE